MSGASQSPGGGRTAPRGGRVGRLARDQRGMTLIEVAVAVAILAIMGAIVYGGLAITIRSQQRAEVLQERYHAARVFLGRFKRELSMAFLSLHQAEDKRTQTLFDGERERITFNTSAHEPIRRDAHESDQLEVEYRLDRDEQGREAIIRRVKLYVDDQPGKGGTEEAILSGVKRFELAYYDKEGEDWESDWSVVIDDAIQKREQLKVVQQAREALEAAASDENANLGTAVTALAGDRIAEKVEGDLLEKITLPNRVRVRLVIEDDEEREYLLETQVEIRVTDPLYY